MSVEARDSMSDVWTGFQGYLVNGVFPLGRLLGCSDHSGVFITKSPTRGPAEVAIKLVPADRALTEWLLPRWKRAGALAHPHLLRLFEWGGCQLEGLPYLYTVMEYADQTLAQLLRYRALTEDEAREMLPPVLDALAYLHGRGLVQGRLTPTNILVVGDQLKLASDTVRRVSEGAPIARTTSVYDPPEALHGSSSFGGDMWTIGVSLFEALTRRRPRQLAEPAEGISLPSEFSPDFRDIVGRCLSRKPQDRPRLSEITDWARGTTVEIAAPPISQDARGAPPETIALGAGVPKPREAPETPSAPVPVEAQAPTALQPEPVASMDAKAIEPAQSAPAAVRSAPAAADAPEVPRPAMSEIAPSPTPHQSELSSSSPPLRVSSGTVLAAIAVLLVAWLGVRALKLHRAPPATSPPVQASESTSQPTSAAAPHAAQVRATASALPPAASSAGEVTAASPAIHEVIPDVPRTALRTIRGHIKVWVRVSIDEDGTVFAAVADRPGPSRYFERLALAAAKKWQFAPAVALGTRQMQIRFEFSQEGTTSRAVTLH